MAVAIVEDLRITPREKPRQPDDKVTVAVAIQTVYEDFQRSADGWETTLRAGGTITGEEQALLGSFHEFRSSLRHAYGGHGLDVLAKPGGTFMNKYQSEEGTTFYDSEGLPMDGVIAYTIYALNDLERKKKETEEDSLSHTMLTKMITMHILFRDTFQRNSFSFDTIHHHGREQRAARVKQEQYFISQDPQRTTGSLEGDQKLAESVISHRMELRLW